MEYEKNVKKCDVFGEELLIFSIVGEVISVDKTNDIHAFASEKEDGGECAESEHVMIGLLTSGGDVEKIILPHRLNMKIGRKIAVVCVSNGKNIKEQLYVVDIEFGNVVTISNAEKLIDSLVSHKESRHVWLECVFGVVLILYWLVEIYHGYVNKFSLVNLTSYSLSLFLLTMVIFFTKIDFRNKKLKHVVNLHRTIGDLVERIRCPILCKMKLSIR
jgi:hypothetical protein